MNTVSHPAFLPLLTLILCGLIFARSVVYRRRCQDLKQHMSALTEQLKSTEQELAALQQKYDHNLEFQKSLSKAEITTRLQQPRLTVQQKKGQVSAPERYHYVRSLAEKGMDAEEIASLLAISSHEAKQLVNLSKLARMNE